VTLGKGQRSSRSPIDDQALDETEETRRVWKNAPLEKGGAVTTEPACSKGGGGLAMSMLTIIRTVKVGGWKSSKEVRKLREREGEWQVQKKKKVGPQEDWDLDVKGPGSSEEKTKNCVGRLGWKKSPPSPAKKTLLLG